MLPLCGCDECRDGKERMGKTSRHEVAGIFMTSTMRAFYSIRQGLGSLSGAIPAIRVAFCDLEHTFQGRIP